METNHTTMITSEIQSIIDESQKEQHLKFPIFKYIYDILITNDIYYVVSHGTLLGTILYNNLIPWDDDIDIIIDHQDIPLIESLIDNRHTIEKRYTELFFFKDLYLNRKIDIFIAQNYIYDMFNIKEEYTYNILRNYRVRIPTNYKEILDKMYGDDWTDIAYITNHKWSKNNLNIEVSFDKKFQDKYHTLPVSFIRNNIKTK